MAVININRNQFEEMVHSGKTVLVEFSAPWCVYCRRLAPALERKPSTELVKEQVEVDPAGYILADESTRTNIPGVFAVGDVRTKALRQVVTAVADGATAVHYAEEYLAGGM